jgi:FkbM family methyltransferase
MQILKTFVKYCFERAGYVVVDRNVVLERTLAPHVLQKVAAAVEKRRKPFVLQIGANDGISNDPIHHLLLDKKPDALLIEPLPDIFERLQKNYRDYSNVQLVNSAIAHSSEQLSIYRISPEFEETYNHLYKKGNASGKSSLDKKQVENFLRSRLSTYFQDKDPSLYVTEEKVQSMTFDELLNTYDITHIDLLQIDTEGYDYEIIKMLYETEIRPTVINYEHKNLSDGDRDECETLLLESGYSLLPLNNDTLAFTGLQL